MKFFSKEGQEAPAGTRTANIESDSLTKQNSTADESHGEGTVKGSPLAYEEINKDVTIVSDNSIVNGELDVKGALVIFGRIDGKVRCDADVLVAPAGRVNGEVLALNLQVGGRIDGNVECGTLHIHKTGKLYGQTATDTFVIDAGGFFEGQSGRRTTDNVTQLKRSAS